ncbi:MAG: hypothetical protein ACYSUD_06620 [Planctomycetota bacterium]|jgi:hypothetical protein
MPPVSAIIAGIESLGSNLLDQATMTRAGLSARTAALPNERHEPWPLFSETRENMASNNGLINRAQCKKFALRWAQENRRGWAPNRVSKQFLDDLDTRIRNVIQSAIARHPSVGQTIKDLA